MRFEGDSKWDRMGQPVSHLAAVVGGVSLIVLVGCGWFLYGDPGGMVRSVWWWGVAGGSGGMLGLAVVAYFVPSNGSAWVLVGVVGLGMLGLLVMVTGWVWRRNGLEVAMGVAACGGAVWLVWFAVKVAQFLSAREDSRSGVEVEGGGDAPDELRSSGK